MEPRFLVVGESSDGDEVQAAVAQLKPDILLLDLNMPRVDGLQVLQRLSTLGNSPRTILLTAEIQKTKIVEALLLGASGLLMKDSTTQLLFKAIQIVMSGQYWICRDSVSDIVQTLRNFAGRIRDEERQDHFGLTPRELEIVSAVASGESNKDIAKRFRISDQTVKHHLTSIFGKLGVSQRLELALFALSHNLTEVESAKPPETTALRENRYGLAWGSAAVGETKPRCS